MAQQFWIRSEGIRVTVLEDEDGVARNFVEGKFEGCRDFFLYFHVFCQGGELSF